MEPLSTSEATDHLLKAGAETPLTIFIDALDECRSDQRHKLLQALDLLVQNSPHVVKIFITSRDDIDIVMRLQKSPNIYVSARENGADINQFVDTIVQKAISDGRLLNGNISLDFQAHIIESLARKAQGM